MVGSKWGNDIPTEEYNQVLLDITSEKISSCEITPRKRDFTHKQESITDGYIGNKLVMKD